MNPPDLALAYPLQDLGPLSVRAPDPRPRQIEGRFDEFMITGSWEQLEFLEAHRSDVERWLTEAEHLAGREGTEAQHHPDDQSDAHEREQARQNRMFLSIGHVRFTPWDCPPARRRDRRSASIVSDEANEDQSVPSGRRPFRTAGGCSRPGRARVSRSRPQAATGPVWVRRRPSTLRPACRRAKAAVAGSSAASCSSAGRASE